MRVVLLMILLVPCLAVAEIYKWVDAQGNVHYGDKPPDQPAETMDIRTAPPTSTEPVIDSSTQIKEALRIVSGARARREELDREEDVAIAEAERIKQDCEKLAAYRQTLEGGGFFYRDSDKDMNALSDDEIAAEVAKARRAYEEACSGTR